MNTWNATMWAASTTPLPLMAVSPARPDAGGPPFMPIVAFESGVPKSTKKVPDSPAPRLADAVWQCWTPSALRSSSMRILKSITSGLGLAALKTSVAWPRQSQDLPSPADHEALGHSAA